jgi:protein-S-isoprenylcysteine O-methyltransferase Ste14
MSAFRFLLRVPVPWVFILGYLLGVVLEHALPLPVRISIEPSLINAVGAAVFALGAVIAGWGWWTFHKAGTTTVPGQRSSQLVTWGPYRYTRNPMYVGLTIAYLGEAVLQRQIWPVILLPLVIAYVNGVVIPVEQAKLTEVFGQEYARYQQRVRRWL